MVNCARLLLAGSPSGQRVPGVTLTIKMPDGSVSLDPSVGNWKYSCRSHYLIQKNRVIDAGPMSVKAIEAVQERDRRDRDRHIAQMNAQAASTRKLRDRWRALVAKARRFLRALRPW